MPEGPDGKTIIIVKKVSGHHGHHGGAWKVAFADFVTAMMAFFMVLWLVNSASVTTREKIASYFREPGVFAKGSGTPLQIGGAGILSESFAPPAEGNSATTTARKMYKVTSTSGQQPEAFDSGDGKGVMEMEFAEKSKSESDQKKDLEELAEKIKKQMAAEARKIGDDGNKLLGKIEIKVDQRGLHIEIMDTEEASMFQRGSASLHAAAEIELMKIAKILKTLPNPIDIEGHTDAAPFSPRMQQNYDNWNLSSDRANAARRILVGAGIAEKQIARVVGYADKRLKYPSDPMFDSNRRISISMRFTELAAKSLEGTKSAVTEPRPIGEKSDPKPAEAKPVETPKPATPPPPLPNVSSSVTGAASAAQTEPPAAAPVPPTPGASGLAVSVETTEPEGEPIRYEPRSGGDDGGTWQDKDKIFGGKNPFK